MAEINHAYAEQNTIQTHTSATFTSVLGITAASLTANTKYLIIARALIGINSTTINMEVAVQTADDTNIETKSTSRYEMGQTTTTGLKSWLFVHSFTTDGTPADIDIVTRAASAGNTVRADQISLLLIDLDAIGTEGTDYHEDINAATGTELPLGASPVTLATIAGSLLGTTEAWLMLGSVKIGIGSSGRFFVARTYAADDGASETEVSRTEEEGEDTAEDRMVGIVARHKATANVDVDVRCYEEANNGNMTDEGSYLIALPTSFFTDFEYYFNNGSFTAVGTEATIASVGPYTPTTNGNHLIIGSSGGDNQNGADVKVFLEDGTTETRTGDSTPTHDQAWDAVNNEERANTMERISISATKTYNLRAAQGAVAWNPRMRWLFVLNLNEVAGAASPAPFPRRQRTTVRM